MELVKKWAGLQMERMQLVEPGDALLAVEADQPIAGGWGRGVPGVVPPLAFHAVEGDPPVYVACGPPDALMRYYGGAGVELVAFLDADFLRPPATGQIDQG